MRLVVAPLANVRHPLGAQLGRVLEESTARSASTIARYVAPDRGPNVFDWLRDWRPRGTLGWQSGQASAQLEQLADTVLVAATYTYSGSFSFMVTMSLDAGDYRVAHEGLWVAELMGCLCLAGTFLAEIPGVGLLHVHLDIQGLENTVSWRESRYQLPQDLPRISDPDYQEYGQFGARELARDPRNATRLLFDRLAASFLPAGADPVDGVAES
jgi:hypothetical protein